MKQFLYLTGNLQLPKEKDVFIDLVEMAKKGISRWFRMKSDDSTPGIMHLIVVPDAISPGEEHEFLDFLQMLGQKYTGKIHGEFQVWWPMAMDSGPQWWEISEDGKLWITESDIVRGERVLYQEKKI